MSFAIWGIEYGLTVAVLPYEIISVFDNKAPAGNNAGRILHDIHVTSDAELRNVSRDHLVTGDLSVSICKNMWYVSFANVASLM